MRLDSLSEVVDPTMQHTTNCKLVVYSNTYLSRGSFWGPMVGLPQRTGRSTPLPLSHPLRVHPPMAEEKEGALRAPIGSRRLDEGEEGRLRLRGQKVHYTF